MNRCKHNLLACSECSTFEGDALPYEPKDYNALEFEFDKTKATQFIIRAMARQQRKRIEIAREQELRQTLRDLHEMILEATDE